METTATYHLLAEEEQERPILTLEDASAALRSLYLLEQECRQVEQVYSAEIERLEARRDAQLRPLRDRMAYLREVYEEPLRRVTEANLLGGKRSIKLPYGTLAFRKVPAALKSEDSDALLAWAKHQGGDLLRVKEEVNKAAINQHWRETGEVPEGCVVEPEHDEFSLRTTEG